MYYFPVNPPPPEPEDQWTPENVKAIIELIDRLAGKYVDIKKEEAAADNSYVKTVTKHNTQLTIIPSAFFGYHCRFDELSNCIRKGKRRRPPLFGRNDNRLHHIVYSKVNKGNIR